MSYFSSMSPRAGQMEPGRRPRHLHPLLLRMQTCRCFAAVVLTSSLSTCTNAQTCSPDVLSQYPSGWPKELDIGIYWFGPGDQFEKAYPSRKSRFYDPAKPTVIYFHGWVGHDGGWVSKCRRITTSCPSDVCVVSQDRVLLAEFWFSQGWNVGFFYWDQFADEECTRDAEQKVWFDRQGDGLRWKSYDVAANMFKYVNTNATQGISTDLSLTNIVVAAIADVMKGYTGPEVRFVGHSIGAQLATKTAAELHEQGHPAAPQRLALLEPFFTRHHLYFFRCKTIETDAGIGGFTAAATAGLVQRLWKSNGVVTEIYKSSLLTQKPAFGYEAKELTDLGTLVVYDPRWCGALGSQMIGSMVGEMPHLSCYHTAVFPYYFLQYGLAPRPLNPAPSAGSAVPTSALSSCSTPSSTCGDSQLREWIDRQRTVAGAQRWDQQTGMETFNQSDDTFKLLPDLAEAYEIIVSDPLQVYGPNKPTHQRSFLSTMEEDVESGGGETVSVLTEKTVIGLLLALIAAFCCGLATVVCIFSRTRKLHNETESDYDSGADTHTYKAASPYDSRMSSDYEAATPLAANG